MRCVFITGAAGFIGGYVVNKFVEEGWHVLALVHERTSEHLTGLAKKGVVTIIKGDVTNPAGLRSALDSAFKKQRLELDVIVHCAGRASDVGWRSVFRRTNFESVKYLVEIAKDLNVGRFVFVSTTDVYGLLDFSGEAEDGLRLEATPSNPYPEFKIAAERLIRDKLAAGRFCIIRPAQVWGVGDETLTSRIVDFLKWSPWIVHFGRWCGNNRWPLAHVRNVATAIFLGATMPEAAGQAINVADSEETSIDEFYRIVGGIYLREKKFRTVTLPFWFGQVVGAIVSGISHTLNLKHPFMDPSLYALYAVSRNLDFSNQKLRDLFKKAGRSMITRDEGIRELQAFVGTGKEHSHKTA